jgi:hypothetical protein
MNRRLFLTLAAALPLSVSVVALPFDPEIISRLSLDNKPRSLAIRQGAEVWLGYDLERAAVFKTWQAPKGKSGLIKAGFTTRSTGTVWFEDKTQDGWQLQRGAQTLALKVRYLGCRHLDQHIVLKWELRHDDGVLLLHERVPLTAAPALERAVREVWVEHLSNGESLLPPTSVRKAWTLQTKQNGTAKAITSAAVHRFTLP